jgi:hypothetical protein
MTDFPQRTDKVQAAMSACNLRPRIATQQDFDAVVAILVSAFHDDPAWSWAFPDPSLRAELALLADNLRQIDEAHVPSYLESSNPANVPLYRRYGFVVRGLLCEWTGQHLWSRRGTWPRSGDILAVHPVFERLPSDHVDRRLRQLFARVDGAGGAGISLAGCRTDVANRSIQPAAARRTRRYAATCRARLGRRLVSGHRRGRLAHRATLIVPVCGCSRPQEWPRSRKTCLLRSEMSWFCPGHDAHDRDPPSNT